MQTRHYPGLPAGGAAERGRCIRRPIHGFRRVIAVVCRVGVLVFCLVSAAGAVGWVEKDVQNAVVNIFTVYDEHDYYRPWQMKGKNSKTGSGCIIDGERILTNAHVVADQTFIQVLRAGQAEKFVARVLWVGHECDLALLTVADRRFFEGVKPLRLGELPRIRDRVAVYGFPTGGTKIAITEGVVSRVENLFYSHSQANLLACQIDAPINPGSSGGPVLSNGRLVGVAFQAMSGENIGYMVPPPVIGHFLKDVEDGRFDGFPALGLAWQTMENPDLRVAMGMKEGETGVLVNRAYPRSPCRGLIDSGDVVLAVEGLRVANDGTVEFRDGERTNFEYPVQRRFIGDIAELEILRRGVRHTVRVPLTIPSNAWQLVPRQKYDTPSRYFIAAGLVFVPLTANFLQTWGRNWHNVAPRNLVRYYFAEPDTIRDEVVVVGQILTDEVNMGYEDHLYTVVRKVNGMNVRRLEDVVKAFETREREFHEVVDEDGYRMVFSAKKAAEQRPRIFQRYRIVFDRSEGLRGSE